MRLEGSSGDEEISVMCRFVYFQVRKTTKQGGGGFADRKDKGNAMGKRG